MTENTASLSTVFSVNDPRGMLCAIEANRGVPFDIARVYYVVDTKPGEPRGFHAHHVTRQFAICLHGSCRMTLEGSDGQKVQAILDAPDKGVLIDPMVWHEMHDLATGSILLVLADRPYEEADYIRSYASWQEACHAHGA